MDFRERGLISRAKNQFDCNASHVFAALAQIENGMLLDQQLFREKRAWTFDAATLSVSELFSGYNAKGANRFCGGGDAQYFLSYLADHFEQDKPHTQLQNSSSFPFTENLSSEYPFDNVSVLSPST